MLGRDTVAGVACSFLVTYYREFVKEKEVVGLVELYGESSLITYAGYNEETTVVAQGRHEIAQHLGKMDDALGRRKVEVRFADFTPLPGGCIHIVCQGILYLRGQRRAFFQVFVLAPTQYRTNTYHIAIDYFRVMVVEVEQIPEDSIIMTPAQVAQHLLEEHERRKRMEESREQLRRQQAAAEALRLQQLEEAARRKEFHQTRGEQEPRHGRHERQNNGTRNDGYGTNTSNRRDRVEWNDDRRGDRTDMRTLIRNEGSVSRNNRPERAERNNGRYDERNERNGERRWERHDGMRGERNDNVRAREERGVLEEGPAPQSTRPLRSREQPSTAASKSENGGSKPSIARPVPRSKAALEKRLEGRAEIEENNIINRNEAVASRRVPEETAMKEETRKKTAAPRVAAAATAAAAATGSTRDPARGRPQFNRTGSTDYARLVRVPKYVTLTDIKAAVTSVLGTEPIDAYWYGRSSADCVLQLRSSNAVEQLVRDSVTVLESRLSAAKFYP
ncbi:hypothetical protein C3747_271g40 [Trypanosoma cruzi]|uniref:NTF2 domain-containing protein n=1 Tax=Trypanosoma cruzi TaxID=5693 RepID=A0A2V2VFX3_TRYCR|nr:hypothetical protein C3747_271g40 [Trypanosoma cruzi]